MNILFTGASSFTGMWFIQELASRGHTITAIFPRVKEAYQGIRKTRVLSIIPHCTPQFSCTFGSDNFLNLVKQGKWDLLCHHAADVTHYKSPDFDVTKAVEKNTHRLTDILNQLKKQGCLKVMLTGSVFEQHEGKGDAINLPVSPYGYSKGLTSEIFRFACEEYQLALGKFVIPNPFGPFEENRFTTFLAKSWLSGKVPKVTHPAYIRDNIHVSLLAKSYTQCVEAICNTQAYFQWNPSGYCGSQGDFTERFAKEMKTRFSIPCPFELDKQKEFTEPKTRINTQPVDTKNLDWNEAEAWNQLANYYQTYYG